MTSKSTIFARRNEQGNYAILDAEGVPVTRIPDCSGVYPVGSDLAVTHEHAEGIVLAEEAVQLAGIEFEDGYRIDTEEAAYHYPVDSEDAALARFANDAGYDSYTTLAKTLGMSVEQAKTDLVITRT